MQPEHRKTVGRNILHAPKKLSDRDISRMLNTHKATVCRWRIDGLPMRDGTRLRLPYTRVGRRAYVHPQDLEDFLGRLTEADAAEHRRRDEVAAAPPRRPTAPRPSARAEQAEREADEMGL